MQLKDLKRPDGSTVTAQLDGASFTFNGPVALVGINVQSDSARSDVALVANGPGTLMLCAALLSELAEQMGVPAIVAAAIVGRAADDIGASVTVQQGELHELSTLQERRQLPPLQIGPPIDA